MSAVFLRCFCILAVFAVKGIEGSGSDYVRWAKRDFYGELGLNQTASASDVRKA